LNEYILLDFHLLTNNYGLLEEYTHFQIIGSSVVTRSKLLYNFALRKKFVKSYDQRFF